MAQRRSPTDFRVLVAWTLGLILLAAGLAVPPPEATTDAAHAPAVAASADPSAVMVTPSRAPRPDAAPAPTTAPVVPTMALHAGDTPAVPTLASALAQRLPSDRGPPST
jgi:hypothetical protein